MHPPARFRRPRRPTGIDRNTAAADLGMVLLAFFVVVTSIAPGSGGLPLTLPPADLPHVLPPPVRERNVLDVYLDPASRVFVRDRQIFGDELRALVPRHVLNCDSAYAYGCYPDYAEGTWKAVILVRTHDDAPYGAYHAVVNDLTLAYRDLWSREAQRLGFRSYRHYTASLTEHEEDEIRTRLRPHISLVHPY